MDVGAGNNDIKRMEIIMIFTGRKKGFVYTLFAIAFIMSLSIFILTQNSGYKTSVAAEKIRSDALSFFVKGVEADAGRSVLISNRKAILALVSDEVNTGTFALSANESILELSGNGTKNGVSSDIMVNSTFSSWVSRIQGIGKNRHIDVNISMPNAVVALLSGFEFIVTGNATVIIYDPLTKIKYNHTVSIVRIVPIEDLEDPYVTIKSWGSLKNVIKKCPAVYGTSPGSQWTYGIAYVSEQSNCSDISSKSSKVFITDTITSKPTCTGFNATITEDDSASGPNSLSNATGAYELAKNDSYVILSGDRLWLSNFTSCYFDAPSGPSFFDRLEGRNSMSLKYDVSEAIEGIGAFINIPSCGYVLDYEKLEDCI